MTPGAATRAMMTIYRRSRQPSLRARIQTAQSAAEIQELLDEGDRMGEAQPRTRMQWARAAAKRREQLGETNDWRPQP